MTFPSTPDDLQEDIFLLLCQQMKVLTMCILVVILGGSTTGELPDPERPYKILMLLAVASESHRNVFMPLVEALANRGHKVGQ